MGHVGDRDQQVPAAWVFRIAVGLGPDRVVEVPGVLAVDGDQGNFAEVFAALRRGRPGCGGLGERRRRKHRRQIVFVDRDQAEGAGPVDPPEALNHPGRPDREPAMGGFRLDQDQLAGPRPRRVLGVERQVGPGPAIGRMHAPAAPIAFVDADNPLGNPGQHPHGTGLVDPLGDPAQAGQHPVARAGRAPSTVGRDIDSGRRRFLVPHGGLGQDLAVRVGPGDLQDHHRRHERPSSLRSSLRARRSAPRI
jgi:hypothetical protein